MNPELEKLHPYPFEKLARLLQPHRPPADLTPIALSIGEPKHQPPAFALQFMADHLNELSRYPTTKGLPELRQAIGAWLQARFKLRGINPEHQVLPVNGTREALFSFTQAAINSKQEALVVCPNPFYQIYEGAAYLAGAQLFFTPCLDELDGQPDFDTIPAEVWQQCQLLFICSPGNPAGNVIPTPTLKKLILLADEFDFIIASDECYSELYRDEANPPVGLLQACADIGRHDYARCVVFHSLSKRSNMPGMRSGFVAGDTNLISSFLRYRTYHGCAMPIPTQLTSVALWQDESHVLNNRDLYREKYQAVANILAPVWPMKTPEASFYLWPKTPIPDDQFAARAYAEQHITLLPGRYLGREAPTHRADKGHSTAWVNPGADHVRMALVATVADCKEAAERLKILLHSL